MDILLITFIGGFILATLIFWPLLRRSQRRGRAAQRRNRALLVQQSVTSGDSPAARGRHAAPEPDEAGKDHSTSDHGTSPDPGTEQAAEPQETAAAASPSAGGRHEAHTPDPSCGTAPAGPSLASKHAESEYAGSIRLGGDLGDALGSGPAPDEPADAAPEPQHGERADTSVVPTDLYERKYAWRFARSRNRLERLRAELDDAQKTA